MSDQFVKIYPMIKTKKVCSFDINHHVDKDDVICPICEADVTTSIVSKIDPDILCFFPENEISLVENGIYKFSCTKKHLENILNEKIPGIKYSFEV